MVLQGFIAGFIVLHHCGCEVHEQLSCVKRCHAIEQIGVSLKDDMKEKDIPSGHKPEPCQDNQILVNGCSPGRLFWQDLQIRKRLSVVVARGDRRCHQSLITNHNSACRSKPTALESATPLGARRQLAKQKKKHDGKDHSAPSLHRLTPKDLFLLEPKLVARDGFAEPQKSSGARTAKR